MKKLLYFIIIVIIALFVINYVKQNQGTSTDTETEPPGTTVNSGSSSSGGESGQQSYGSSDLKGHRYGLFTMKTNGKDMTKIIGADVPMKDSRLSPDGKKVAYSKVTKDLNGDGKYDQLNDMNATEICTVNVDGTDEKCLTSNDFPELKPTWSLDGQKLFFISSRSSVFNYDIYSMDLNGGNVKVISSDPKHESDIHAAAGKIVYTKNNQVWIMNEDGTGQKTLTNHPKLNEPTKLMFKYGDFDPILSPDGTKVAFERLMDDKLTVNNNEVGNYDIMIINTDGSGLVNITNSRESEGFPYWSPDGKKFAFLKITDDMKDLYRIFTINVDGSSEKKVNKSLDRQMVQHSAQWFPSGDRLLFSGEWFE